MQWEERQTVPLDCEALLIIVCQNIAGISQVITEAEWIMMQYDHCTADSVNTWICMGELGDPKGKNTWTETWMKGYRLMCKFQRAFKQRTSVGGGGSRWQKRTISNLETLNRNMGAKERGGSEEDFVTYFKSDMARKGFWIEKWSHGICMLEWLFCQLVQENKSSPLFCLTLNSLCFYKKIAQDLDSETVCLIAWKAA